MEVNLDRLINDIPVGSLTNGVWVTEGGMSLNKENDIDYELKNNPNPKTIELSDDRYAELTEVYLTTTRPPIDPKEISQIEKHLAGKHNQQSHANRGMGRGVAQSVLDEVRTEGGLSVKMIDGSKPPSGYMVATSSKFGQIVNASDFFDSEKGPMIISDYLKSQKGELKKSNNYLGLWHNKKNDKIYLDVSENIKSKAKAKRAGRDRDQLSIWDVINTDEISTGGTGNVGKTANNTTAEYLENDRQTDRGARTTNLESNGKTNEIVRIDDLTKHLASHDESTHGRRSPRTSFETVSFTGSELSSIATYTKATIQVNRQLRGTSRRGIAPSVFDLSENEMDSVIDNLDSAIDKSRLAEKMELGREMPLSMLKRGSVKRSAGKVISDKGFLSLRSTVSSVPPRTGFAKFRVTAPAGTKALDLSFLTPNSMGEIIFPRETKIKINSITGQNDDMVIRGEIVE